MARKYDLISELYNIVSHDVVEKPQNWQDFLRSACYNFKLRFDEQLLIYAQRPSATAVLEIERWNNTFGRWVNKGATGIAVFEDADRTRQRLIHYFDISDTHESRYSRPVPIWNMKPEYTDDVIETLENTFGELSDKSTLAKAIYSAAKNATEDNLADYLSDFQMLGKGTDFEYLSAEEANAVYVSTVTDSVAFMIMSRLGVDTEEIFDRNTFDSVTHFSTPETLNALGFATSDIAEMGLSEISRTINALNRENRIIAENGNAEYNKDRNKNERGYDNDRTDLHDAGRLQPAQSDDAGTAGSNDGTVRTDEEEILEGASQSAVLQSADELQVDGSSERSSAESDRDGGNSREADGSDSGRDRETESRGYNEMGTSDEQSEELGSGDRQGGSDLRLEYFDRETEDKSLPFFGKTEDINEMLGTTPHLKASKDEIREFYLTHEDEKERTEYIKSIFNPDYTELILKDSRRVGYKTYQNVLHLWEGSYLNRTAQSYYDWTVIARHFEGMRLLGELQDTIKPLPSVDGQMSLMETQAEEKTSAFTFSQEIIDRVLTRGSGVQEGKMRIYEQFQKSLSAADNIDFLKNEYGWGGAYPVITGTGIDEVHDGKGIHLSRGFGNDKPHIDLKWNTVEKRIAELIRLDRYLNPKEKEIYPEWLKRQEEHRAEIAEMKRNQEILNTAPPEKEEPTEYEYAYHLGDKVYIGASEYEILSFDDERVMLFDTKFPLFNDEMSRSEFDEKVRENPLNDHLKVKADAKMESEVSSAEPPEKEVLSFTVPENDEQKVLYQVLHNLRMDDIELGYDENGLVATDYDNTWHGADFYRFLSEAFVYQDDGTVALIPDELYGKFKEFSEQNGFTVPVRYTPRWTEYMQIKEEYPEAIALYQVNAFYEILGADAETVQKELDLMLGHRRIAPNEKVPMCGIPFSRLETYTNMLLDRGYDVAISDVEDDKHITRLLSSNNKEEPIASKPIGRIEYLGSDGKVGESIEYTSEYQFVKDIKAENYYGSPMKIVTYRDENGNTIPLDFISQLDPPPQGFEVIDSPYLPLSQAKSIIDDYCREEFQRDEGADYSNLSEIGVAYTTTEDDQHEIQANVNLVDFRIDTIVDGEVIRTEQYDNLTDMIERGLKNLSFDDLVYLSAEELDRIEKASAPVVPAFEQRPKSKVQTFDLHPDIPMSDRHTFDLANHEVEEVGKKERFRRNMAAINVLKECEFDNRFATPEEQEILSKYVGWGGIPEAFDENNAAWANEFQELYAALSPEEYAAARESTLTAFYTPPVVISAIYKAMEQMGFREGNILEPSCGIGNFIGMLPQSMQDSKMYGVELDTISAGIAQQLYQKTSIAAQPFEQANIPDSFFDAVVGNVPFGDFKLSDKRYDKYKFLIHDYFFAKSLDKLRPGGVMALVTSKGTMDKENPAVRKYIAQRADLLGAIRLPNNTFKGNAGTEVVSDILILQKRDRIIDIEPDWVHLNTDENGITMNSYFVDHPEMILGEMKMVSGRFGMEPTCVPYENADLESQLAEAISNIHGEVVDYETDEELSEEDNSIPADPTVRNFSYTVVDDKIYFRENSRMTPVDASATAENRIKGLIQIRDTVRNLIDLQMENYPDEYIKREQEKLNEQYDAFTKKYGLINSRANTSAFSQDSSFSLISALEIIDEEGQLERKADMFYKRTIKPHEAVTSVDTASEALAVSMGEKAHIDMAYMSELSGKTEEELFADLKGVIFLNPLYGYGSSTEPKYLMADEYLSGNVREKLAVAKRSAEVYPEDFKVNVEALEKVQPTDLTASEISVRLGATWLPPEIVEQFMFEFFDTPRYTQWRMKLHYSPFTGEWNIENKSYDGGNIKVHSTYGTTRINGYKILEETLNLKDVRIFDYIEDAEGKKKAVLNKKETAIAQAKQELIKQGFQDWVWSDPARREKLCKIYNEKFNSVRPREFDGSHIVFHGMNPEIELKEHQRNAVAHILYGGNTLLAHAVGAGKTFEMVAAAMESKRLGLCNKSLIVVPNHLTEQWAAEFLQLYPAANVLVATKKDFETKNRKRFCGRIATGDYDAIIIGHSQFEKIPMSIERQRAILEQQLDEITDGIADLKRNRGDNFSVKQLEKTKKSVKQRLEKLNDQSRKDDVVTFEELGVDRLFIDESHYYKNLFLYTKMRNVGGIAQTEAQKSSDLFMKCRYLDELTGGRGTVFATGTPISNSMVELYTIQRYLQYNTLVKNGLQHFDAWASTFGETVTAVELTPEGTGYRAKTRFARFYNLPELMAMFKEVADIKTADMLNLPVPKANFHNIAVKPSEMQKEMVAELSERADKVRNGMVDASVDNMLKITNDGRKLALDQRLINDMLPDYEGSKLNACVDNIYRIWEEGKDKYSAQLFFCDLSTPKNDDTFSVYTDIRKKLIERGVPENEVQFIHDADTEAKKLELFKKTRKGEVRLLMGSTQKMGAGTNVQNKLIALHDLDCPWRPSDLEQRLGRIVRQGNENTEVDIFRYVTEETFDAYLYQLVEGKQKFASQIMTSKSPVRSCEDIDETALSYAEIKMLATGNPYIKEKMDLDIQVQKLRLLKSNFLSEKYALEDKIIKFYPQEIARRKDTISGLKADIECVKQHPKPTDDKFIGMTVQGAFFAEKSEAGQAIIDACGKMTNPDPIPLGEYRGFQMELSFDTFEREYRVRLKGELSYSTALGSDVYGNITRLDNVLEGLEKRLDLSVQEIENNEKQFESAKVAVEKPFEKEEELKSKTARLDELNILLNMDKRENEIVGGEPDEGEAELPEKKKQYER